MNSFRSFSMQCVQSTTTWDSTTIRRIPYYRDEPEYDTETKLEFIRLFFNSLTNQFSKRTFTRNENKQPFESEMVNQFNDSKLKLNYCLKLVRNNFLCETGKFQLSIKARKCIGYNEDSRLDAVIFQTSDFRRKVIFKEEVANYEFTPSLVNESIKIKNECEDLTLLLNERRLVLNQNPILLSQLIDLASIIKNEKHEYNAFK
ncbi:hypothetical protein DDB_G0288767 [Dictyostelium discoideum AX4]|uniref:Putative uncharacterized protein DDB_G0288767 n=1 Tax=Dictyostelium discoideum TaxID=44689 RepID=Y9380_DICDI|nr:hypothetical protein DDB_G0288767 [Dictyostelium discoideum AX4]Q54IG9.1 RecName: Full=Putative uncharacterized protein DDB_G0288767 [Dictyostelium discoideum]EAL63063.1 hypothetical protein DDB_G0288767 [Dictyostelium discoideum AX4]|eukprot:XP_636566.1 hypothetical protein DDB_G0288767 [Dictyostelium discoideum AX4]